MIVRFGPKEVLEGDLSPQYLGGKGAGLCSMSKLGMPVPPGFVIPTSWCKEFEKDPKTTMDKLMLEVDDGLKWLEDQFGYVPLVSVRSGAPVSMPGMMDTILNVGLNAGTRMIWANRLGVGTIAKCEARLHDMMAKTGAASSGVEKMKVREQIRSAIETVFRSWRCERAIEYRKIHGISDEMGTAVVVQAMVFGNMGPTSGTGVCFTRHPASGEKMLFGEFLANAQGEDVVSGAATPLPISEMEKALGPSVMKQLVELTEQLEKHYRDMQDIEFTVQDGKLFLLQTRSAKRSALAKFVVAHDLYMSEMLTMEETLQQVSFKDFLKARQVVVDPSFKMNPAITGIPACPGVVTGRVVLNAKNVAKTPGPVILVRPETNPEDIAGMHAATGIVTATGGATSHAAVVARSMNKPCVVGCQGLTVKADSIVVNGTEYPEGVSLTMDGMTGSVWVETKVPTVSGQSNPGLAWFIQLGRAKTGDWVRSEKPEEAPTVIPLQALTWDPSFKMVEALWESLKNLTKEQRAKVILDVRMPKETSLLWEIGREYTSWQNLHLKALKQLETQKLHGVRVFGSASIKETTLGKAGLVSESTLPEALTDVEVMRKLLGG